MTGPEERPDVGPRTIDAWAIEVAPGEAPTLMDSLLVRASDEGASVLVLDGGMVFGKDHLASALMHARRAIAEGRNASDSLQMETMLYSSGERQLGSAIRKMSVTEETTSVVAALLDGERFHPGEGWRDLPRISESLDPEALGRFGIGGPELETIAPEKAAELVLERVANVDLTKK